MELCDGRWVAVGGGGYDVTAVPRVWTLLFSTMLGRTLEDPIPAAWLQETTRLVNAVPADKSLRDRAKADEEAHVSRQVKRTVDELQNAVFPLHGIR